MKTVDVKLGGLHGYHDYAPIPERFTREFQMRIFGLGEAGGEMRKDGVAPEGSDDCVSETILSLGIWEPPETILTLSALEAYRTPQIVLDFGSQIGWYSLLALSCGHDVWAFDANLTALGLTGWGAQHMGGYFHPSGVTIDEGFRLELDHIRHIALAKIDVEGAELFVLQALRKPLELHQIDHVLMEVSPVWGLDEANVLVNMLIDDYGYEAYTMPPKRQPPLPWSLFPDDLVNGHPLHWLDIEERSKYMEHAHQENVWFCRPGVVWA